MKRFSICFLGSDKLISAIQSAEDLLTIDSLMIKELRDKNDWKYNSGTGFNVITMLLMERDPVNVFVVHKTKKTSAIGYFQNGSIYVYDTTVNTFDVSDLVGNLLHEYSHYCGFNHYSAFGTSNFKTKAKCKYSVPYYLSENVKEWI